jgi:hypothetical protein
MLMLVCVLNAMAQMTATVRGMVTDPHAGAVDAAVIGLTNPLTGFSSQTLTAEDGSFHLTNVPFQSYTLTVTRPGFSPWTTTVHLRTNIPQVLGIQLQVAQQVTQVDVTATDFLQVVDTESTGTRTELNLSAMNRMPVPPGNRGLENMLVSLPGFAANANGAIHPRGAHNQMSYIVDGMPIVDQLTGAFANAVDPAIVQTVELFTGNVPAEFGGKISGVAVITTKTGLGSGRLFSGSTETIAGGFDTAGNVTQIAGGAGKWGYFASFNVLKSNRYLDQVSIDNLHNGGNTQRAFGRADYMAGSRDVLRFSLMAGRSSFQLANLRSQHAAGQDQRQSLGDTSVSIGWIRTIDSRTTVDTTASFRTAGALLLPSPGDRPVTASQDRRLSTITLSTRANRIAGRHNWRAGLDLQRYPIRESFTLGITAPDFNEPQSDLFIPTLAAHDLTRGGTPFLFAARQTGGMYSGFAQDTVKAGAFTLTLGVRYDNYRFLVQGAQWQPRIGFAYHVAATSTVFRASYNRTYQTPPNENLLLSSSDAAAVLVPAVVRQAFGRAVTPIRPERQNVFEVGMQQGIRRTLSISAAYYHKNSRDMQDNDNFLNTGIIFPITLAQSRTNGAEARIVLLPRRGFSGSLSLTHIRTIVTPPFTGGLFLGSTAVDSFSAGPFIIDHDQVLGMHGLLQYNLRRNVWISGGLRYDSGLVANPSDPARVALDPDYADLLPYVNLDGNPPRVRPRTVADMAVGYEYLRADKRFCDVVIQMSNMANTTALYNFQSIFVGTRLIQPRTASIKLRFWF